MKYTSALISDARNKLGGDVFARNRAGLYVRVKVKPKNPKSTIQQANRAVFSTFTKGWRSLTAAQIAGWNNLAANSTLTDTLGNSFQPSGLQLYIGLNRNLAGVGFASIADAPAQKPAFPTIFASASHVYVRSGAWAYAVFILNTPATLFESGIQGYLTHRLSNGVSFVGASLYRSIGPAAAWGTYYATFGIDSRWPSPVPAPGQQVGIRCRLVDAATGYASMPETQLLLAESG